MRSGDLIVKLDLKDAYFSISFYAAWKKFERFSWKGILYKFACPMQVLRRMKIKLTFYLDDILVLHQTLNIILKAKDTIIHIP